MASNVEDGSNLSQYEQIFDKISNKDIQTLLGYYRDNPVLWNSSYPDYRNREIKASAKKELVKIFDNKYSIEALEKKFHSLRTSMRREVKRTTEETTGEPTNKKRKPWPYFELLSFLKEEIIGNIEKEKEARIRSLSDEEKEVLIAFYKQHPMLWNPKLLEYRNRDLRRVKLELLAQKFNSKYSSDKLQQEWHNLITIYERERGRHDASEKSGAGTDEIYISQWPYYKTMEFSHDRSVPDEATSSLRHVAPVTVKKSGVKRSNEAMEETKIKLWQALAEKLTNNVTPGTDNSIWQQAWQQGFQSGFQQGWQQYVMQAQMQKFPACMSMQMPPFNIPVTPQPVFPGSSLFSQGSTSSSPGYPSTASSPEVLQNTSASPIMFHNSPPQLHDPSTSQICQNSPPSFMSPQHPSSLSSKVIESRHVDVESRHKQQNNKCFVCSRQTKYMCVKCNTFVCNMCSQPAHPNCENYNEDGEYRHVGYCQDCFL